MAAAQLAAKLHGMIEGAVEQRQVIGDVRQLKACGRAMPPVGRGRGTLPQPARTSQWYSSLCRSGGLAPHVTCIFRCPHYHYYASSAPTPEAGPLA